MEQGIAAQPQVHWLRGLPCIMTERMLLRIAVLGEEQEIVDYVRRNREHLEPWEPARDAGYYDLEAWSGAPERDQQEARNGDAYRFRLVLKSNVSEYIGTISLRDIVFRAIYTATLGYSLDHKFQGQGLMREGVAAVTWFAFHELNLRRIEACYMPSNVRSARLLKDLGFEIEGLLRSSLQVHGKWEDHYLTSLINHEWKQERK